MYRDCEEYMRTVLNYKTNDNINNMNRLNTNTYMPNYPNISQLNINQNKFRETRINVDENIINNEKNNIDDNIEKNINNNSKNKTYNNKNYAYNHLPNRYSNYLKF